MFASYGAAHQSWNNPTLLGVCLFVGVFLPKYSRISNKIEERANNQFAIVTMGRLARFAAQLLFNLVAFTVLYEGGALRHAGIDGVGGTLGAALVTTLASQGAQYFGILLCNRGIGDLNRNVQIGLSANVIVTALATAGLHGAREVFLVGGIGLGGVVFAIGVLSDLRGYLYPRRGVGVFFGTFNPFHRSHLALVRRALEDRKLDRVVIHPTTVPRFHRQALAKGEIRVARIEDGMQVYAKTERADVNVDYFPTGHRFFAPETRRRLIELAIDEAGLSDKVEVLFLPDLYAEQGFHGVLREIRRRNPGVPLHGIHGSDFGGMLVRAILDECGWVYPMPFLRRDGVSATAIRAGAEGMTTESVNQALRQMRASAATIIVGGRTFRNEQGVLSAA